MLISFNWLKTYVEINVSPQQLAESLTMVGLEVEYLERLHAELEKVVVARIEQILPHPNADKLKICQVNTGKEIIPVVCGAPNIAEGQNVALVPPGCKLPSGMEVKVAKIRGVKSYGMLCSEKELGIGSDHSGIVVLEGKYTPGENFLRAKGLEDWILEVAITPNRGDCLSHLGIARETAAILGKKVKYPVIQLDETGPPVESLTSVTLDDPIRCPRYSARVIEGVEIKSSPDWLRARLESVGLRSINNIVDVTNYVMLEYGQPLHAFDFDRLAEHRIVVRTARDNERFVTLDGVEHLLDSDMLLICDGEKGVALAGIMGGENSEIQPDTKNVLIESAFFDPYSIRKTSKKLGINTESSYRFERRVDPDGVIKALDRAAQLMLEVGGGQLAAGRVDQYPAPFEPVTVEISTQKANRFLGTSFQKSEVEDVLQSIELETLPVGDDVLKVNIPLFRGDITREVDLFEEVARLKGYDLIPDTVPVASLGASPPDPFLVFCDKLRDTVAGLGFSELITYSFIHRNWIERLRLSKNDWRNRVVEIKNPLSEEQSVMRTTLIPCLLETVRRNIYRKNVDLRIFELSRVFVPEENKDLPDEPSQLVGAITGARESAVLYNREEFVNFYDLKGVVEGILSVLKLKVRFCPSRIEPYFDSAEAASIALGNDVIGQLGLINEEVAKSFGIRVPVYVFEMWIRELYEKSKVSVGFQPLPKFPSVTRDLAIVVDQEVPAQAIVDMLLSSNEPLLESVLVFDVYRGKKLKPGKVSIGYRLTYRAPDRNLTDEEVNKVHNRLAKKVIKKFKAALPE